MHTFTCVLALQIAHLLRLQAGRAGLRMSVRELLTQLAGIGETVLIYPAERGRPKVRRRRELGDAGGPILVGAFGLISLTAGLGALAVALLVCAGWVSPRISQPVPQGT